MIWNSTKFDGVQGCTPFFVGDGGGRFLDYARNDRKAALEMTGRLRSE